VKTISLPPKNFIHWSFLKVYGWGSIQPREDKASEILQKTYLYLIPFKACEEVLLLAYGEIPLHETELCAGNLDGSTDTCTGDSGGPLVQINPSNGKLELVAIVSWGPYPCNLMDRPSVNTRVSAYVDWIKENIS
jgi:secreted trypsin-like serine protease